MSYHSDDSGIDKMFIAVLLVLTAIALLVGSYLMDNVVNASADNLKVLTLHSEQLNSEEFNMAIANAFDDGAIKMGEYRSLITLYEKLRKEQVSKNLEDKVSKVSHAK